MNSQFVTLIRRAARWVAGVTAILTLVSGSIASAETLLMPKRDFLMGTSEVVWGATTLANGTSFTLEFGDGTSTSGTVADRSYIAFNHTYAISGPMTVKLTVGAEQTTVDVNVYDASLLSASDLRGLNINRAIQDGLRWLWTAQENRATNWPAGVQTNWGQLFSGERMPFTALVVLAFENHGYNLPNNDSAPSGDGVIYKKYLVQRGLNYLADHLIQLSLPIQEGTRNPCVGTGIEAAPCTGLYWSSNPGYSTAVVSLPFSGSNALSRHVPAGLGSFNGNYVAGKTLGEVLQRIMNAIAMGQNDGVGCIGRGGWIYGFSNGFCQQSDGSTVGWDILALLDAAAAGTVEPAFVKSEFVDFALPQGLNTDGTFDYRADNNAAFDTYPNMARAGIALQALYYAGNIGTGDAKVVASRNAVNVRWPNLTPGGGGAGEYTDTCGFGKTNFGCAYAMYNVFKGLRLQGITSFANSADWYKEYVDWLVANQTDPTTLTGGNWVGGGAKVAMGFSCCNNDQTVNAAIAELILAPVALVQPDPGKFSTVGLSPATATNPVGTDHTVTAKAESAGGTPVPGATIDFKVLDGPNAGKTGSGVSDALGQVKFTYHDDGGAGTDHIQASIGALKSNIVEKIWQVGVIKCDVDGDKDVDATDLALIYAANRTKASGPNDPRDVNHDGKITVSDYRTCQRLVGVAQ